MIELPDRWAKLLILQEHYADFTVFLEDVMLELGFKTTDIQRDIAQYLVSGPRYLMVQAGRGQAKSTITMAFTLWSLLHSPGHIVLIVSAAMDLVRSMSTLCSRLLMGWDVLACMRPDRRAGDRVSVTAFDIHHELKGYSQAPSISCIGIGGTMEGKRADLTILDDIESQKNSQSPAGRQLLSQVVSGQLAINIRGRIIFLGTPQSRDSVYNSLGDLGVQTRIWPARYPTPAQLPYYGDRLAPLLAARIAENPQLQTGGGPRLDQGQPIDPAHITEAVLLTKATLYDGGFELQYMLDTSLSDAVRYPLKTEQVVVVEGIREQAPLSVTRSVLSSDLRRYTSAGFTFQLAVPQTVSPEFRPYTSIWACVDPSGGGANGDETAWAVVGLLNSTIYVLGVGSVSGGYATGTLEELAKQISEFKLSGVTIEKNLGYGAFAQAFLPVLRKYSACALEEDYVTVRKELRIIDTLGPIISRGSLVIDSQVIEMDRLACEKHPAAVRQSFSLFYQIAKIQDVKGCLKHDDRLDALAACCHKFRASLMIDKDTERTRMVEEERLRDIENPMGYPGFRYSRQGMSLLDKWRL